MSVKEIEKIFFTDGQEIRIHEKKSYQPFSPALPGSERKRSTHFQEDNQMKEETDLIKIKGYANLLLISGIAKTPYSPAIVQHPFTNSGIIYLKNGSGQPKLFDLTKDQKALADWRKQLAVQINRAKSVMDIYTMLNKAYCLTFLKEVRQFLSSEDFSELLSDAWIRSEYPNDDPNMSQQQLLSLFRDAEPTALMNTDEYAVWAALPDPVSVYRGVTSYNAKHIQRIL